MHLIYSRSSAKTNKGAWFYARVELCGALLMTACAGYWQIMIFTNAGALWRDEILSLNVASLPTIRDLWQKMFYDSCPVLWLLILRGWKLLGFSSDQQLRLLGLLLGLSVLGSVWLVEHWFGNRCPTVCLALICYCPTILYSISTLRAYGVGILTSIIVFGLTWRAVLNPSRGRLVLLLSACLLVVHSLWINSVLVFTFMVSGAVVHARRKHWRAATKLLGIGVIAAISLGSYLPRVRTSTQGINIFRPPAEQMFSFWSMINNAISSAGVIHGMAWALLNTLAIIAGVSSVIRRKELRVGSNHRDDLITYNGICLILGTSLYLWFYYRLHVITPSWYYAGIMVLAALCIENLLFVRPMAIRTVLIRISLAGILSLTALPDVWHEVHLRRTNVDLIAKTLSMHAAKEDLILVSPFYCGTTFDHYYTGHTNWITIPPTEPRFGGGFEQFVQKMYRPDAMNDLMDVADRTLRAGYRLWIVCSPPAGSTEPSIRPLECLAPLIPPQWVRPGDQVAYFQPFERYWKRQVCAFLSSRNLREYRHDLDAPADLINPYEFLVVTSYKQISSPLGK